MKKILVIAPHPDDETLGCGGMLLKERARGSEIFWVICTKMDELGSYERELIKKRNKEIKQVAREFGFANTFELGLPAANLDKVGLSEIVGSFRAIMSNIKPTDLFLPYRNDAHNDHAVTFDAGVAASKWFRCPSVKSIYCYETLSETDFDLNVGVSNFKPNIFFDITGHLDRKIEISQIYKSEFAEHPFPRSTVSIRALAELRGATAGFECAEAFMLLRQRVD